MMNERPTAIVVDDSQAFLMYLSILLNRMNIEVLPVTNAPEALEIARVTRPNLMTLDMVMPEPDGIQALRTIREDDELADLPVIMISSYKDKNRHWEAQSLGCIDVLDKPIDLRKLHRALQYCNLFGGGRRRYLRAPFNGIVRLRHGEREHRLTGVTLSERGVFVRMRHPYAKGTNVQVTLPLMTGEELSVGGEVIYAKSLNGGKFIIPPGVAIKFNRLTASDVESLSKMVTELLVGDILVEQDEEVVKPH